MEVGEVKTETAILFIAAFLVGVISAGMICYNKLLLPTQTFCYTYEKETNQLAAHPLDSKECKR